MKISCCSCSLGCFGKKFKWGKKNGTNGNFELKKQNHEKDEVRAKIFGQLAKDLSHRNALREILERKRRKSDCDADSELRQTLSESNSITKSYVGRPRTSAPDFPRASINQSIPPKKSTKRSDTNLDTINRINGLNQDQIDKLRQNLLNIAQLRYGVDEEDEPVYLDDLLNRKLHRVVSLLKEKKFNKNRNTQTNEF
jgi:hypothetical protein